MPNDLFDASQPAHAESIWRQRAMKKLEHGLQRVSNVQGYHAKGTRESRLLGEAYEFVRQVYIDLLDLSGK